MMADQRFPKSLRVLKGEDFTRVLRRGGCAADGTLVVFALPRKPVAQAADTQAADRQSNSATRLGVTIPKKTGNAVVRNQWKRLVRESFRMQREDIPLGYDIVVRPKKDAHLEWAAIRRGLPRLITKAIQRIEHSKH